MIRNGWKGERWEIKAAVSASGYSAADPFDVLRAAAKRALLMHRNRLTMDA
jgi:hypothetical protein